MRSVAEKLEALGYSPNSPVFSAVLDVVASISIHNLTEEQEREVLNLVSPQGMVEILDTPLYEEDAWVDFDYGNVKIGDYVRVKPKSYDSDSGLKHNSRVGVLLNLKARRCTVRYIGINSKSTMQHPIGNLQSLKYSVQWKTTQK